MSNRLMLSVLIPTMESRHDSFLCLSGQLDQQIRDSGNTELVEVLNLLDDGSLAIGSKRNQLMDMARGSFIVFVDDDDRISSKYIQEITQAIKNHPEADCICFNGEISFRGKHRHLLKHSNTYEDWLVSNGEYLRPPCHIMPIRRKIALQYQFAEVDFAEDMDWTMRMCKDKVLEREIALDSVLYFYDSRRHYAWQWILDKTQGVRHALGLRYLNKHEMRQKLVSIFRVSKS
jgi:glycosyltransferase involved in cell wall biosynthesis